jgi:16S rRNA (guanine966-N2)-methyltransferase
VRIIAGKWRGRKLHFPNLPELRPTPNRVRETLFNWLSPHIAGSCCLDLFTGSGALGFESLSRGASFVFMVDQSKQVIQQLRENAARLHVADELQFYCGKAPSQKILIQNRKFNIAFLDPPFHHNYLPASCQWLEDMGCLATEAFIYIEAESTLNVSSFIPENWRIVRNQQAGQVGYYLVAAHRM